MGIVSKCKPNDPIAHSPVGSTETPDPVDQKEISIQIDIMKIVTTDESASSVGTPPSSDSGIHSWGEQWENMSISTTDTEAEQNGRPRIGIPTGWRVSDTRVPPNTEEDQVITFPWMDCLLNRDSDESSSPGIQNYDRDTRGMRMWIFILTGNRRRMNHCGRITKRPRIFQKSDRMKGAQWFLRQRSHTILEMWLYTV